MGGIVLRNEGLRDNKREIKIFNLIYLRRNNGGEDENQRIILKTTPQGLSTEMPSRECHALDLIRRVVYEKG